MRKRSEVGFESDEQELSGEDKTAKSYIMNGRQTMASSADCCIGSKRQLTVTWGKEGYQPRQYHNMDLGPFVMTVQVEPGDNVVEVYEKMRAELDEIAKKEFEVKLSAYLDRISRVKSR